MIEIVFGIYLVMKLLFIDYIMDTQKIQISEVKDTAPLNIINNEDQFLLILEQNDIKNSSDLKKINIEKSGNRYLFTLSNNKKEETKFALANKYDLEKFLLSFLDKGKKVDEEIAVQLVWQEQKELLISRGIWETKKEAEALRNDILAHHERSTDPNVIQKRIGRLKEFFDDQKDNGKREQFWLTAKYARSKQERRLWESYKNDVKIRLKDLNNIEKMMKDIDSSDPLLETKLKNISQNLDKLAADVTLFESHREELINGVADITPVYGLDITKLNKIQSKKLLEITKEFNKAQGKVTENTELFTQEQMRARDLVALQTYLEKVANSEIDPASVPFTAQEQAGYNYLVELYNKNKNEFPGTGKDFNENLTQTGTTTVNAEKDNKNTPGETTENTTEAQSTGDIDSWKKAFEKQGLNGLVRYWLDKTNMTPEQKGFWWGAANLAMIGGIAFLGWKFLRSSFKLFSEKGRAELKGDDKNAGEWGWLVAPLLVVGVTQGLTWESPRSILNGGKNTEALIGLFGGKKNKENTPATTEQQQYVEGLNGTMALFNGKTRKDVQEMLTQDNEGKMKIKPEYYTSWKAELEQGTPEQQAAAAFLEKIGENDPDGVIDLALTGMGLSWEELSKSPDKKFDDQAMEVIWRLGNLYGYMETENKNLNPETMDEVKKYLKTGTPTLEDLKARYDIFETPLALDEEIKQVLKEKIESLNITDPKQKKAFTEAFYRFYQNFPAEADTKKYIDITRNGNDIELATYHYKTKINLDTKTIPGFLNSSEYPFGFTSYQELLNVANLTNRIKFLTKDLEVQGDKAFSVNTAKNIIFNSTKWYDVSEVDKRILSEDALKKNSYRLGSDKNEKEAYVKYLNSLGTWKEGKNNGEGFLASIPPLLGLVPATNENITKDSEVKNYPDTLQSSYTTIENLSTTPENKKLIKKALNMFYEKYPRQDLKVELTGNRPLLSLETYGKKTYLNLDNKKELQGLNVSFDNYFELFKAANLTNRLRDIFKNTQSKSLDPFHIELTDIGFDTTSALALETDTRAISSGFFGDLKKVSRKLYENKDFYSKYLNNLWLLEDKSTGFFAIENTDLPFDTKQNIIKGFKEFYKAFPNSNKEVKMIPSGTDIAFQTYETNTPLDLVGKKIVGLDVTFPDYFELFKAANLINRIKQVTKDKEAGSEPFNKSLFGRDIEFNQDNKFLDTEAVSAGLWGTLNKISPQLEDNKTLFINYLDQKRADKLAGKSY